MATAPHPHLSYGGDYNPEQWDPSVWKEDVARMREAGVTSATVGVFSWARLQPTPDTWDFAWLDEVMDLLHEGGVRVCLATATASPPPWLARLHPRTLPRTADGTVLWPGARQHYCPSSPEYREAALTLVEAMAARYGTHPALELWHINNEYGCHLPECLCDGSAAHFRRWLRDRHGTLEALNSAWSTSFWSQAYADWEEVWPPRTAPYFPNPAQQLDWRRFCSDAFLQLHDAEREVLRRVTPHVPATTNFHNANTSLDLWRWGPRQDVVSYDSYPDPADPDAAADAAFAYDLMRSLGGGKPWLLMEQGPGRINWRPHNLPKEPGLMRLWSLQAVARGADGVHFFQWRASRGGAEKYCDGMVPRGASGQRVWREVCALGEELKGLGADVAGRRIEARAAVVLDVEAWWALELDSHPSTLISLPDQVRRHHRPLWEAGFATDVVHPEGDLDRYRLLLVPSLTLLSGRGAAALTEWVREGGHLVVSFFSGIVDGNDRVHDGGWAAPLREVTGAVIDELWPLPEGAHVRLEAGDGTPPVPGDATADLWADVLVPDAATTVLLRHADGPLAARPAVIRHHLGAGTCTYLGTRPDPATTARLVREAADAAGLAPVLPDLPPGVEAARRGGRLFLLNHRHGTATVPLPPGTPPQAGVTDGRAHLPPLGVLALHGVPAGEGS